VTQRNFSKGDKQPPKKIDNVPTGSWRVRKQDNAANPTPAEQKNIFNMQKVDKKERKVASNIIEKKTTENAYHILGENHE
jgi:hypothetical protein